MIEGLITKIDHKKEFNDINFKQMHTFEEYSKDIIKKSNAYVEERILIFVKENKIAKLNKTQIILTKDLEDLKLF
jgi:hypothetical protein